MALTPKDNEAFYREVDEELRRDQMRGVYARYGTLIIAAAVVFLAAVGGYLWWQNHTRTRAEGNAEAFSALLDDAQQGKVQANDARLAKIAKDGNIGYRTQAQLLKAGLEAKGGKPGEALAIYRTIAANGDVPQPLRDAALIRQTALEYDGLKPEAVVARLKPLAVPGNPWFGSAGEMVGIAYMRQGKSQLAAPIFEALAKDETVPVPVRQRAGTVAASLGVDLAPQTGAANAAATKEASR